MPEQLLKYFPLVKVDEAAHMAYGLVTCEDVDSDGERCIYDDPSKPMDAKRAYKVWSEECLKSTTAAGQDPSLGNIRQMHQLLLGGKAVKIDFDDAAKQIFIGVEPADDDVWQKIKKGMYRGFSQGGNYAWRDPAGSTPRNYAPVIGEVSLVDNPSLKAATFQHVKADGSMELVKFATPPGLAKEAKTKRKGGKDLHASDFAYVGDPEDTSTWKLPIHDAAHVRNALARFNQTEGIPADEKAKVKGRIRAAAKRFGVTVSDEAEKISKILDALDGGVEKGMFSVAQMATMLQDVAWLLWDTTTKRDFEQDASTVPDDLRTALGDLVTIFEELAAEESSELLAWADGGKKAMNPEQIKKCAAALGISEDEFKKQFVSAEEFEKAKKGLTALHAHIQKAIAHHEKMHKKHGELSEMHEEHAEHLDKCAGLCKDLIGAQGEVEGAKAAQPAPAPANTEGFVKAADVDAIVAKAVKDAIEKAKLAQPAGDAADNVTLVGKTGGTVARSTGTTQDALDIVPA